MNTEVNTVESLRLSRSRQNALHCHLYHGDNVDILDSLVERSVSLIYIDPPLNTGKTRKCTEIKTIRAVDGKIQAYDGNSYKTEKLSEHSYDDSFDDYISFLAARVKKSYDLLAANGSFFLHIDYRKAHYCKLMMDGIFGRANFINEIIWSYDHGARSKTRWSANHDNILWYVKDKKNYIFNYEEIDRISYMTPDLVGEKRAAKGKTPTDVWWHSIVGTNSYERKAAKRYLNQKPLALLERIVKVHSNIGNTVLDFFAGSGAMGIAALRNGRKAILIDKNHVAIQKIRQRIVENTFLSY